MMPVPGSMVISLGNPVAVQTNGALPFDSVMVVGANRKLTVAVASEAGPVIVGAELTVRL